jgi:hypothetical protein
VAARVRCAAVCGVWATQKSESFKRVIQ